VSEQVGRDGRELTRRRLLRVLGYGSVALMGGRLLGRADAARAVSPQPLITRLNREWGLEYPIVGAGMGFYALPELVAAISNAGALGVLGAAAEPPPRVLALIRDIKTRTNRPFGVDFVNTTLLGAGVPAVTDEHIEACAVEAVPLVVFFWDPPSGAGYSACTPSAPRCGCRWPRWTALGKHWVEAWMP
jgi:hypothetical protein